MGIKDKTRRTFKASSESALADEHGENMEDPLITYTRKKWFRQPCCDSAVEAASLRLLLLKVEDWWHKEWHQATGIPCDGTSEYCPLTRRLSSDGQTK